MGYADLVETSERLFSDDRERRLFLARARARRRDEAQKRGVAESEIPWGIAFLRRPDSWLPYERDLVIARGRQLAREHGWDKDLGSGETGAQPSVGITRSDLGPTDTTDSPREVSNQDAAPASGSDA